MEDLREALEDLERDLAELNPAERALAEDLRAALERYEPPRRRGSYSADERD